METSDKITIESVKSILLSKTFWFNVIMGLVALTAELNPEMLTSFGIPDSWQVHIMKITGVFTGLVNIYFRMKTTSAVSLKLPKKVVNNENQ